MWTCYFIETDEFNDNQRAPRTTENKYRILYSAYYIQEAKKDRSIDFPRALIVLSLNRHPCAARNASARKRDVDTHVTRKRIKCACFILPLASSAAATVRVNIEKKQKPNTFQVRVLGAFVCRCVYM